MDKAERNFLAGQSPAYVEGFLSVRRADQGGSCGAGFTWVNDRRAENGGYCRRSKGRAGRIAKNVLAGIGGLTVASNVAGAAALGVLAHRAGKYRQETLQAIDERIAEVGGEDKLSPQEREVIQEAREAYGYKPKR
jgi:hypothetical protein